MEQLIALVDSDDNIIGYQEKYLVHSKGLLHRAFSILVFNSKREILLQQRANDKYHSAGLWTNTCCSHLPQNHNMESFIHERLIGEMGFDCELKFVSSFHYQVTLNDGMTENEIDHIYIGFFEGMPSPNSEEVSNWKWCNTDDLRKEIQSNPEKYTYWFKNILENHFELVKNQL